MHDDIGKWVEELMTAGCMPKVAARVVTQVFAAGMAAAPNVDPAAEKRRAWDREYRRRRGASKQSGGSGGNRVEMEPTQWLWRDGLGLLRQLGAAEKAARNNIGLWLKAGNDPALIKELIVDAHQRGGGNPIPYITAGLGKRKSNGTAGSRTLATAGDDLIARAEMRAEQVDDSPFDH